MRDDIRRAAARLAPHVRRTPLLGLDDRTVLKLELLQYTGSFKPRGAFNAVLGADHVPDAGLIAASGGNHGQAVAYVGRELGLPTEVFVPTVTSPLKRDRIAAFGATVVVQGALYDDAQAACRLRAEQSGALAIHPYDDPAVIAGQGTVAMELWEDDPTLDTVLVAVGGGGLMAGVASWYQGDAQVIAVEPERSCCLHAALAAGEAVDVEVAGAAADSLGARRVGARALTIARRHVARSLTVTEAAIAAAQRHLWEQCRIATEPGGATAFAALLDGAYVPGPHERVGVIVCGGNVDPVSLT